MSDVGDGASFDFAFEAIGFAEEDGGRGVAIGHGGDVHAYIIWQYNKNNKLKIYILHAYKNEHETAYRHQNKEIFPFSCQNFGLACVAPGRSSDPKLSACCHQTRRPSAARQP